MNISALPLYRLSETCWRAIIVTFSVAVLLFSVWCLSRGITTIFTHLYYFPIVLLAYRYRWKGCGLATLLAFAYLGLVIVFDAGQADIIPGAFYRFLVFVGIAAVIAYLSDRLAQAHSSLQHSAELNDRYLSLGPAIVLALDRNGAITYLNKKGGEILECTPDDVIGKSWPDRFLPERERERVKQVISQLMAGRVEPNRVVENPVLTSGGVEKSIRWSNTVFHDKNGAITGILSSGEDISEEKWRQDALREMQQFQESVITNANVWISVLEPDGTLLVWNDAAEAISGYKKTGVLGKKTVWKQLYPDKEYRKKVTGEIQRIIGRDTFLENFETEIRCADGTKKTIVWNTRGLRKNNGAITSYIAIGRDVTAQKSAEEQVRWSNELYREFFKTSRDCIFITSPQGQWIDFSESARGMFGYGTREDLFRVPIAEFYHNPEDRRKFVEFIGREGFTQDYPVQLQRRDGHVIDTLITTVPLRNPDGSVRAFVGTIRDITEHKRAEENLAASEMKFRQFFNNISDALYLHTLDDRGLPGKFIEVNDVMCERLGYSRDELLLLAPQDILSDAGRAKMPAIAEVMAGKGHATFGTEHRRKDGSIVPVEVSTVIFSLAGTRVAMASARDITERKRAEETLSLSEERYRTLAEASPDQIFINDRNGTIMYANTTALKLFGLRYDQVVGKQRRELFPPELFREQDATFREVFDSGEPVRREARIRFGEQEQWIDTNLVPLKDTAGQVTAVLGVARDITERKRAEVALTLEKQRIESLLSLSRMGQKADTEIIAEVVEDFIRLTGSTIGYLATMNEDESVMTMQYWSRSAHESCRVIDQPIVYPIEKTGLWGEAVRQRKPIVTNDYAADSPFKRGTPPGHVRLVRHMNIPVFDGDHIVAVAGVGNKEENYDEGDIRQLQLLTQGWWQLVIRKRVEEQLHASRQLFADIISFLPDPTFVIDRDGKVIAWNRALEQLSGISAGEIIGKGDHAYSLWQYGKGRPVLIDLVLNRDQDAARLNYTDIHRDGNTITAQTEIIHAATGKKLPLSLVASPLIDSLGNTTGAIESMRDVSRLKEAEVELARINKDLELIVGERTRALQEEIAQRLQAEKDVQAALDYTRSVIEANPDLMVILDGKGTILDVNTTAEVLTGLPRDRLIGTSFISLNYLVDDGTLPAVSSRLIETGRLTHDVRIRQIDGRITPLSVNATMIKGVDENETRIIVAGHDITRQKQDEEAIRASLEEQVILLREVHHRVKNNLQIIISLTNLQMRQADDPGVKQIMAETQNRVRAMSLVHEKLYRSESLSHIDFADYTRFLATQLFSFYGMDTRRVRLEMTLGKIMVDINTAVPLGLIMNELISNALKHAFPNGRKGIISISGGENVDLITLVVRDNGIGIPEELDWKNTTTLGMRLVTSLIDQVGGTITLDRNQGTALTITIKRDPATGGEG